MVHHTLYFSQFFLINLKLDKLEESYRLKTRETESISGILVSKNCTLGKEPNVEGELDAISPIVQGMEIEDDPYTEADYTAVKKSINEGRACGPETRTFVQKRSYTTTEKLVT